MQILKVSHGKRLGSSICLGIRSWLCGQRNYYGELRTQSAPIFTWKNSSVSSEKNYAQSQQTVSMRDLLYRSIKAAERGGEEIKAVWDSGHLGTRSKSIRYNPVTLGDIRSHVAIKGSLQKTFPAIKIISEEDELRLGEHHFFEEETEDLPLDFLENVAVDEEILCDDVTIWIDPLDGTNDFTDGLPGNVTTMVGISVRGEPVAGVIHRPFPSPETFWAWNGRAICSSLTIAEDRNENSRRRDVFRVAVSKNPLNAGAVRYMADVAFSDRAYELIPMGGAGFKIIQVLLGNVDAYMHVTHNIKKWDVCAGHAMIRALNGEILGLNGETIDYSAPKGKNGIAVKTGFICSLKNHDNLVKGCQKALQAI